MRLIDDGPNPASSPTIAPPINLKLSILSPSLAKLDNFKRTHNRVQLTLMISLIMRRASEASLFCPWFSKGKKASS